MFFGFGWVYIIKQLFKNFEVREVYKSCNATVGMVICTKLYNRISMTLGILYILMAIQIHNFVVLLLFSLTFALSCTMFELIIFEIVGFMDSRYVCACVYICVCVCMQCLKKSHVSTICMISFVYCLCLQSYVCVYFTLQFTIFPLATELVCHVNHPHLCNTLLRLLQVSLVCSTW